MSEKEGPPEGASTASGTSGPNNGDKEESALSIVSGSSVIEDSSSKTRSVVSQADMRQHFIPILLEKGSVVHKMGKRMARPAKKGEVVKTIVNGAITAETVALDDTSMVIRQESADHELYKLDAVKFAQNFNTIGFEIVETEPRFEELRKRGFRYYERKGQALIYQVTEKDMEFVPGGWFENAFSTTPSPLSVGDYLLCGYPEPLEVYMSRHNTIYQDGQVFHGPNVVSQQKMREHFLEKMRIEGGWYRRAGMRLARPARKGEEVCTIINGELVSKMIVPDDTSMIIQEESADREIYCLSMHAFKESYEPEGKDITEQGSEFDALRERGFKSYAKTGGMVLMYQITAEDIELVPSGYFQVPFSLVPFPLRVGDSLVTRDDIAEPIIYASRNAEQVYYSQKNLVVHYVFASPLGHAPLSFAKELDGLRTSGAIVRLTCATSENLRLLKKVWGGSNLSVLHVACHVCTTPTSDVAVLLEDQAGQQHAVTAASFVDLVIGKHVAPQVVVLTCCNSKAVADAFLERGVERVVAVRENNALLDRAAHDFTLSFYGELRAHRSIESSFEFAIKALRTSPDQGLVAEAEKFMLLPVHLDRRASFHLGDKRVTRTFSSMNSESVEPHIAVRVPFGVGEAGCIGPLIQPDTSMAITGQIAPSRSHFIVNCLSVLTKFRVLKLYAPPGSGKKTIAGMLAKFAAFPGGRAFSGGAVMIYPLSYSGIPSQEEMRRHFLPLLNKKGTLVQKVGKLPCRPAKKGEEVQTVIDGEVVARIVVDSDDCMVVRHDSADHELYVHKPAVFNKNYITPGTEITEEGPEFDALRERGFKNYERRGMVLLYKVTEEDMLFLPEGKFQASFSETPIPIKVGDHLATSFPNPEGKGEVYLSRNAEQIYLSKVVRTNKEMYHHFAPIMAKEGTIARRVGKWFARPAIPGEIIQTIVGMQVVSRITVSDKRSMVVLADSAEGEQYVLNERQFAKAYRLPGEELTKTGPEWDRLRSQGFRCYERVGTVRIVQVTEAHLEFVPAGKFWGNNFSTPQDLEIGDYLVTGYPDGRDIYVSRNAEQVFAPIQLSDVVRSQDDMRCHFLPLLIERGLKMQRKGRVAARPATKGETIRTIIDGEMVAKSVVQDDSSMVLRAETCDREMYILHQKAFSKNHSTGVEICQEGAEFDALRRRGFKWYARKGMVYLHEVTAEDFEFVPGGSFVVSFSSCPQPLQIGDFLAVDFPDGKEIYLSRNALQVYEPAEEDDGSMLSPATPFTPFTPKSQFSRQLSRTQSPQVSAGSPALWLHLQGRRQSGTGTDSPDANVLNASAINTSSWTQPQPTRDVGMATKSILEDALLAVASKQAALAGRWYEGHNPAQEVSGESAMASWLRTVPSGSRALLVLVGGESFLAHDAPRELLRRLLRSHPCLHLLVTLADKQAAGPVLDPSVGEHPWPVELPPLQPREAADLFCKALMRHQQGRHLVAKMTLEQAVFKLEQLPVVLSCGGRPRDILETVERVAGAATSLDDL